MSIFANKREHQNAGVQVGVSQVAMLDTSVRWNATGKGGLSVSSAMRLAAEWMLLAQMLIMAARRYSLLSRSGACGVEARAEAFELQLRCLLVVLARQIDQCEEDADARKTLCVVYSALIALTLVAAKMRADLRRQSETVTSRDSRGHISPLDIDDPLLGRCRKAQPAVCIGPRGYFDSS